MRQDGWGARGADEGRLQHRRRRARRASRSPPSTSAATSTGSTRSRSTRSARPTGRGSRRCGVSAHTKVDPRTGELLFFNYATEAPYMHYGVVDADNRLVHYVAVPLPGPRLPHDMAFTENYAILNDLPAVLGARAARARASTRSRFHPDLPTPASASSRAAAAPSDIRWFEAEPDLRAALDQRLRGRRRDRPRRLLPGRPRAAPTAGEGGALPAHVPLPRPRPDADPAAPLAAQPRHRRGARRSGCTDTITEFGDDQQPLSAGSATATRTRATGEPGWFLFNGLVRHDPRPAPSSATGCREGVFGSEPRDGPAGRRHRPRTTATSSPSPPT